MSSGKSMLEDARNLDVDVDGALGKACCIFGVSKLSPQQKKAIKAWQVAHVPDCFGSLH